MSLRSTALLAVIAAMFAVPALAADLAAPVLEPATPLPAYAQYNWSGPYVGVQAGYGWGKSTGGSPILGSRKLDPNGPFGGLHAGYNYQFPGGFVLGAEGDANLAGLRGDGGVLSSGGAALPGTYGNSRMDWNASIRARAGYGIDRFLPYITGGVAFGGYKFDPVYGAAGRQPFSDTLTGWTIGGGLEYGFTDNITGRIEYRYTDYGNMSTGIKNVAPLENSRTDLKTNDVHVGVSYKF
ncbi:outer membrane protein [Labrys okinawensis]|uniref:outer membrane protein n=1 Tax=Labrys okinawensis TaxID=346911 RepID=UPI0039BCC4BE